MLLLIFTLFITIYLHSTQAQYDDDPTARKLNLEDLEAEEEQRMFERYRQYQHRQQLQQQQLRAPSFKETNKYSSIEGKNQFLLNQPNQIQPQASAINLAQPNGHVSVETQPSVEACTSHVTQTHLSQPHFGSIIDEQNNRFPHIFGATANQIRGKELVLRFVPAVVPIPAPLNNVQYNHIAHRPSPVRIINNAKPDDTYNHDHFNQQKAQEQNFYTRETELLHQEQKQQQQQQEQQKPSNEFELKQSLKEYQLTPPQISTREGSVAYAIDADAIATNKPYQRRQQRQQQHQQHLQFQFHQSYEIDSPIKAATTLHYAPPGVQYVTSNALFEVAPNAGDDDTTEYKQSIALSTPYTSNTGIAGGPTTITATANANTSRNRRPQSNQLAYAPKRSESATLTSPTLPFPPSFISITTRRPATLAKQQTPREELAKVPLQMDVRGVDVESVTGISPPHEISIESLGLDALPDFFAQRQSNSLLDSYIPSWVVMGKLLQQQQQQQHQQQLQPQQRHNQPEAEHNQQHQIVYINGSNLATPNHSQQFKRESSGKTYQNGAN